MANEAIIVELLGDSNKPGNPVRYTVADGVGIAKGTLMKLSGDPRTIEANAGDGDIFVGIAAEEKVASDGKTSMAVYTKGIFTLQETNAGEIAFGSYVKTDGANMIATADEAGAQASKEIVGMALETIEQNTTGQVWINK